MAQNFLSDIQLGDNIYIRLGGGDDGDLRLYHNATHSYIDGANTGDLYIRSLSDDVVIQGADDVFIYTQGGEDAIIARGDGGVEIFYNNSKKLETTNTGIEVDGKIQVGTQTSSDSSIISQNSDIQLRVGSIGYEISPYIRLQGKKDNGDSTYTSVYGDIKLDTVNQKLVFNDPGTNSGTIGQFPMTLDNTGNLEVSGNVIAKHVGGAGLNLRRDDTTISGTNALGYIGFAGDDPTDGTFNYGSLIRGRANGSWASGAYPGELEFQTRNTSGSLTTALTLNKDQSATFTGSVTAGSFVKSSGTSSQFLKADGSVDSNTYLTSSSTQSKYLRSDTSDTGTGTITLADSSAANNPLILGSSNQTSYTLQQWHTSAHGTNEAYIIAYGAGHSSQAGNFAMKNLESGKNIFFELAGGVVPLIMTSTQSTFAGSVTADSFVKDGGTSSQYLMADGSVSTSVTDTTKLPLAGGTMTGDLLFNVADQEIRFTHDSDALITHNTPGRDIVFKTSSSVNFDKTPLILHGTGGHATLGGDLSLDYGHIGAGTTSYMLPIGFNRHTSDGTIINSSYSAYQLHNYQGSLKLQVYNSAGTFQGQHSFNSNLSTTLVGSVTLSSTNFIELAVDQTDSAKARVGVSSGSTEAFLIADNTGANHVTGNTSVKLMGYDSSTLEQFGKFHASGLDVRGYVDATGNGIFAGYTSATSSYAQNFYVASSGTNAVNRIDNDGSNLYITYGGTTTRALEILNSNGKAIFKGNVDVVEDLKINPDYNNSNEYLFIRKHQSADGGIVMQSKTSGGTTQSDWQIVNHASTGDLKFYAYGLGDHALILDREDGNAAFAGDILAEGGDITVKDTGAANAYFRAYATGTGDAGIYIDASNGDGSGSDYFSLKQLDNKSIEFNSRANAGNTLFYSKGSLNLTQDGANSTFAGSIIIGQTGNEPLKFSKSVYGDFDTENFFRIKLQDQGGIHNDVGIGQTASGSLGFNITNGSSFIFNNGTGGNIFTINGTSGVSTFAGAVIATGAIQVPYAAATKKPMIVLQNATTYGLFHTEASDDIFSFDFNGSSKHEFKQDGTATFTGDTFTPGLYVNTGGAAVSGTQVAIVSTGSSENLQRWGSSTSGQDSYRFRIDQNFKFIGNSGSGDKVTIDSATGDIWSAGDITIGGNLTVTGNTTSVNVEDLNVEQGEITLNYGTGDTSAAANGSGIRIQDAVNSTTDATILWDKTNLEFDFSHGASFGGNIDASGSDISATDLHLTGGVSADSIVADEFMGTNYSVDSTSGTTAIIDTVTLLSTQNRAAYEVIAVGNPNAGGSGSYRDFIFGKILVTTGFTSPNVLRFIHFVRESPLPRDMHGSGGSNLTMEVVFWDGSSESETFSSGSGTPTIRVKIDGYNSSYVGSSTSVRLKRIM